MGEQSLTPNRFVYFAHGPECSEALFSIGRFSSYNRVTPWDLVRRAKGVRERWDGWRWERAREASGTSMPPPHSPISPFPNSLLDKFSLTRSRERSEWTVIDENGKEGRKGKGRFIRSCTHSLSYPFISTARSSETRQETADMKREREREPFIFPLSHPCISCLLIKMLVKAGKDEMGKDIMPLTKNRPRGENPKIVSGRFVFRPE